MLIHPTPSCLATHPNEICWIFVVLDDGPICCLVPPVVPRHIGASLPEGSLARPGGFYYSNHNAVALPSARPETLGENSEHDFMWYRLPPAYGKPKAQIERDLPPATYLATAATVEVKSKPAAPRIANVNRDIICANCEINDSNSWYEGADGISRLCRLCDQYFKTFGWHRPPEEEEVVDREVDPDNNRYSITKVRSWSSGGSSDGRSSPVGRPKWNQRVVKKSFRLK